MKVLIILAISLLISILAITFTVLANRFLSKQPIANNVYPAPTFVFWCSFIPVLNIVIISLPIGVVITMLIRKLTVPPKWMGYND